MSEKEKILENIKENKLINKLIFYSSYLHTLAEQGEHLLKTDTLKQITLAREYILQAIDKLKEYKPKEYKPKGSIVFDQILNFVENLKTENKND